MTKQTTNTVVTETATIKQPINFADGMHLLRTTSECLRHYDANDVDKDFYITRDEVKRVIKKNGERMDIVVETWKAFSRYGEIKQMDIAELGEKNWYFMDFDEDGNPIWDAPGQTNNDEETATA